MLSIQAYVYEHRYEPAMRTDILRRSWRELTANHILHQPDRSFDSFGAYRSRLK
jgi:hypothetical protein